MIEGTDGVGRSTHIALLRTWLESRGHAVLDTGMTRSVLAGRGIKEAKTGHTLGRLTMQLFYASDFVDRLENEMLPALRAGFVVLTDRYIYSSMARAEVRGIDSAWIRSIYEMALVEHIPVFPLPGTGGNAKTAFDDIMEAFGRVKRYQIGRAHV